MTPHDRWLEPDDEPDLGETCEYCDGHGSTSATYSDPLGDECPACKGTGIAELTESERRQKAFDDFDPPDNDFGEPL
jgi:hypothetical protein